MGTGAMVPYSNPAGNNQMSPMSGMPKASGGPMLPGAVPSVAPGVSPVVMNPLVPPGAPTTTTGSVPNVGGLATTGANVAGDTGALQKQETDIYGKGIGGAISSLLAGMSGTDSKILQEYIASLQPEEAKAQANINASLGAGGVSANSSVAGIADASLQAQEFAAISGESAKLTQSQEELTAGILTGQQGAASKEVASSGWQVFGDVLNSLGGVAGQVVDDITGMPTKAAAPTQTPSQIAGATSFQGDGSGISTTLDSSLDPLFI